MNNSYIAYNGGASLYIDLIIVKWLKSHSLSFVIPIGRFIAYKILKVSYILITENHGVYVK